jgi:DNA polymerase III epsilon subunit-like protein
MKARLIVIDTETGGFDPSKNALLSVAVVDSLDNEAFTAIIRPNPEWICEPEALAKNGFTLDFLEKNGRPELDVMQDLALWLGTRRFSVMAGCNVTFDRDFLRAAFARNLLTWPMGKMVDLQAAAWLAYEADALALPVGKDGQPRLSLDHIAASLGFSRSGKTHNALEDALMTLACFHRLRRLVEMSPRTQEAVGKQPSKWINALMSPRTQEAEA